jgi:hypothetical protein
MSRQRVQFSFFGVVGLFVLVGTYNAVVINAGTGIPSGGTSLKRLDELYGVTVPGRHLAGSKAWTKLGPDALPKKIPQKTEATLTPQREEAAPSPPAPAEPAAIADELSLSLVEVTNPARWPHPIPASAFQGSIQTANGVIEDLTVSLPGTGGISVSFSELTGNVFQYDYEGDIYSGMMYQADQSSYVVTLTNGPLEGTRLRFTSGAPAAAVTTETDALVSVGTFGGDAPAPVEPGAEASPESLQAQGFNMGPQEVL